MTYELIYQVIIGGFLCYWTYKIFMFESRIVELTEQLNLLSHRNELLSEAHNIQRERLERLTLDFKASDSKKKASKPTVTD